PLDILAQGEIAEGEENETPLIKKTEAMQSSDKQMSQESLTEALPSVEANVPEIESADVEPVLEDEISSLSSPAQTEIHTHTNIPLSRAPQTEVQLTVQVEAREEEPQVGQLLCYFEASDTAQSIAISILSDPILDRSIALRDLVWRLIYEDKLALAFHTA